MNVTIKNTPTTKSRAKIKSMESVPFSHPSELLFKKSPFNNQERPLKSNSQNLSFEGLFYTPIMDAAKNQKVFNAEKILQATDKYLGPNARELFAHIEKLESNLKTNMFSHAKNTSEVTFKRKSVPHLIYDGLVYPVKVLPGDILNGAVGLLGKIKPFQKWAEKTYDGKFLTNLRHKTEAENDINALRGIFEFVAKSQDEAEEAIKTATGNGNLKEVEKIKAKLEKDLSDNLFTQSVKMFDPTKGNYNTKHERSLNRIVSGAVPAVFLANDAYNLSRMCDDDKSEANKERKVRLKQETSRVALSAYITLVTMGALQKYINKSKIGIMLTIGSTVLFTEMFSRLTNGKHITKLTPEQAKAINAKNGVKIKEQAKEQVEEKPNTQNYKQVFFKAFDSAKNPEFKGFTQTASPEEKKEAPLLNFKTIAKACAVVIAAGFGIKGLRKIEVVNKALKSVLDPFNNLYKKLTINPNYQMPKENFDKIINKLKTDSIGFEVLAKKYEDIAKITDDYKIVHEFKKRYKSEYNDITKKIRQIKDYDKEREVFHSEVAEFFKNNKDEKLKDTIKIYEKISKEITQDGLIHLGAKDKGIKPLVNFVIAPFKFIYNTIKLPYTLSEKIIKSAIKPKSEPKDLEKLKIKALSQSLIKIEKEMGRKTDDKLKVFLNENISKAFNEENMSSLPNNELANLAKTSATAATLWFLMTDNHNMVMLKSNGEDKKGAELKFKERFVQEGSRLFYQTLLIDLFNSTFRNQYNGSLLGMSLVTILNTLTGEALTRKSIGMPIQKHSRDELIEIERKKENATGFAKGYFDFMTRLTGKKSLAEQNKVKQAKKEDIKA